MEKNRVKDFFDKHNQFLPSNFFSERKRFLAKKKRLVKKKFCPKINF